jgi:outer membrane protein assembly factor BamB
VYASAAVADPPGLGPTVYVGSYDGYLYAFNAQSGAIRWRHFAGGRISGAATVLGNVVYYSNLGSKTTTGLKAANGQTVFSFPDGAFGTAIADYHAIYLIGYTVIYQLLPGAAPNDHSRHAPKAPPARRPARTGPRTLTHDATRTPR